jgi:octopine/nopaline transport system permease protein
MPKMRRFRRIIVPQVMRFALPGLGNVWQLSLKDSSLVSVTGLAEIMRESHVAAGSTHKQFLFHFAGAALYLLLTSLSNRAFNSAEAHVGRSFRRSLGRA